MTGDSGGLAVESNAVPTNMPAVERCYYEELSEQGRVYYGDVRRSLRGDIILADPNGR